MELSTNRKNRVLRAPATNDSCETPIPGTDVPFRRDRVLRVPDLNLRQSDRLEYCAGDQRREIDQETGLLETAPSASQSGCPGVLQWRPPKPRRFPGFTAPIPNRR